MERTNGLWGLFLSEHAFLHELLSPIRLVCLDISSRFCLKDDNDDKDTNEGYAWFVGLGFWFLEIFTRAHPVVQMGMAALYVVICGGCKMVEHIVAFGQQDAIVSTLVVGLLVLGAIRAMRRCASII
jgi:hypothetical protein